MANNTYIHAYIRKACVLLQNAERFPDMHLCWKMYTQCMECIKDNRESHGSFVFKQLCGFYHGKTNFLSLAPFGQISWDNFALSVNFGNHFLLTIDEGVQLFAVL